MDYEVKYYGSDLGTANSAVAVLEGNEAKIRKSEGSRRHHLL